MFRPLSSLFACAAVVTFAGLAQAQTPTRTPAQEAARAEACVPPPCEAPSDYPPCEKPEIQHKLRNVGIFAITVEDGPIVRPLGGAITGPPELSVCVQGEGESFILYLPSVDEPVLRLGMLAVLNTAMQGRAPVDIAYGLPNGALRKIEGVSFGMPSEVPAMVCGYGDFDRCDTAFETKPAAERARDTARITRVNLFGYGKGSRAAQFFTDNKARPSFLIDPAASPERFLQLMNFALTAQLIGMPVEITSAPGLPPSEAQDKSPVPPLAVEITPAAMR